MDALGTQVIKSMCAFSFHTVASVLTESKIIKYPASFPQISAPLFVTWKINSPEHKEPILRGCIGTFSGAPLTTLLSKYAIISAFKDPRFPPISKSEIDQLYCTVSILCNFEKIKDPYDWEIGKHGVEINFTYKGAPYSSTFLPEVAGEQHWSQKETINKLLVKAGFNKSLSKVDALEVTRYQSKKDTITYMDYMEFHKQNPNLFEEKEDIKLKFYNDDDY